MEANIQNYIDGKCVGCGICSNVCKRNAIAFQKINAFSYPAIKEELCSNCGACLKKCPCSDGCQGKIISELYAVQHNSKDILKRSQSGGVFTLLSDFVIENGGTVYGAILDIGLNVVYSRASNSKERDLMCTSKYVQALIPSEIYDLVLKDLKEGRLVLFSGTPCYVHMAKKRWGNYENLITLDFICHGVPSHDLWKSYLSYQKKRLGKIRYFKFRNQFFLNRGWHSESLFLEDGSEFVSNCFASLFYSHLGHRKSCFECRFASEIRFSDFTMGGFLDPHSLNTNKEKFGVSMLFVNTEKGLAVFNSVKKNCKYEKCEISKNYKNQPCLYHPVTKPDNYEEFWKDYKVLSFDKLLSKYVSDEIIKRYHLSLPNESDIKQTKIWEVKTNE